MLSWKFRFFWVFKLNLCILDKLLGESYFLKEPNRNLWVIRGDDLSEFEISRSNCICRTCHNKEDITSNRTMILSLHMHTSVVIYLPNDPIWLDDQTSSYLEATAGYLKTIIFFFWFIYIFKKSIRTNIIEWQLNPLQLFISNSQTKVHLVYAWRVFIFSCMLRHVNAQ